MNLEISTILNSIPVIKVGHGKIEVNEIIQCMKSENLKNLAFSYGWGFTNIDMSFLTKINEHVEIESIYIGNQGTDLSSIQSLEGLISLVCSFEMNNYFDFKDLNNLNTFIGIWNHKIKNLDKCITLENLRLYYFKGIDLQCFSKLKKLVKLELFNTNIKSLNGIQNYMSLESIEVANARYLVDFTDLKQCPKLKKLSLSNCKKINNLDFLFELEEIEEIFLENCGEIDTIKPLNSLPNLKNVYLTMSTKIIDGDLTPLIGKKVIVSNHKHYSHKYDVKTFSIII